MRFNAAELLHLAHQPSGYYDKEGILFMKEKQQDGLFRKSKGEVYIERLFRLRGNLLFYFKTKEKTSELLGVYVLERCVVALDEEEDDFHSLVINFEGGERVVRLSSRDETQRDEWMALIHIASFECLKIQMESLRDRLRERTGSDPLHEQQQAADTCSGVTRVSNDETFLEMSISCSGLPVESSSQAPDSFCSIHYQTSQNSGRWEHAANTETVEKRCDPFYLSTVSFGRCVVTDRSSRVKVIVHNVRERMTSAMTQVGVVEFLLCDVLPMAGQSVSFKISTGDVQCNATLSLFLWFRDSCDQELNRSTTQQLNGNLKPIQSNGAQSPSFLPYLNRSDRDMLQCFYASVITKTFRLKVKSSNPSDQLIVHEYMGESKLTYILPKLLLKLLIEEERNRITQLKDLGDLDDDWAKVRQEVIDFHMGTVVLYQQHVKYLNSLSGTYLKASAKKGHKEVEFAPTNLHIQRMVAYNTASAAAKTYDVITVGAFMAGAQKFKHGGLQRMLSRLDSEQTAVTSSVSVSERLRAVSDILSAFTSLNTSAMELCDKVCSSAVDGNPEALTQYTEQLVNKGRDLIKSCELSEVIDGIGKYSSVNTSSNKEEKRVSHAVGRGESVVGADKHWAWNGTDVVQSNTDEPWELTRLNCEAALLYVQSQVEALVKEPREKAVKWLDQLSPLIIKLKRCVEMMCARAQAGLIFMFVQECSKNLPLIHSIRYRRDVVLSQAVTACTAGFITKFYRFIKDKSFISQISNIGVLMEFENLLSCYGEDVGKLEDMVVGVKDLENVVFRFEKSSSSVPLDFSRLCPSVSGDRSKLYVTLPVEEELYKLLPGNMRSEGVRIVPVMFDIGINEQATMAEKFGNTSLQDNINVDSYRKLWNYYQSYQEWKQQQQKESHSPDDKEILVIEDLMKNLHVQVVAKKSKNVDVLQLASSVCLALNGVRFTSCKSAKDRTSMAVTLEQVQLLQKENSLDPETFLATLECMRSEGVRRENTYKNTGFRKYAFNSIQVLALPKFYRPPAGTYGRLPIQSKNALKIQQIQKLINKFTEYMHIWY